jgi:hypothetical protein
LNWRAERKHTGTRVLVREHFARLSTLHSRLIFERSTHAQTTKASYQVFAGK